MSTKITEQHHSKPAYIYVRQSTLAQVRHHQESTKRQYALREKALALGWPETSIRTLDGDLGKSGAQMTGRDDFKTLVADVSMGHVGAVFALEVSRLARSNLDSLRLLELCALTHTLVIDADGCYDPGDFNDGLLLGLKGTMAELHFLRGRLQGGKLNKAQKGELRFPLPVGLCYGDEGRIVLEPDDEVRGAVQLVFRLFHETGSAYAVVKRFAVDGLRLPKRSYGGAWAGHLIWGRLSHGRVPAAVVEQVRELAQRLSDPQIVAYLNQEGQRSPHGKAFTLPMIKWVRHKYAIPHIYLAEPDELTVKLSNHLQVSTHIVYYWLERGIVQARKLDGGTWKFTVTRLPIRRRANLGTQTGHRRNPFVSLRVGRSCLPCCVVDLHRGRMS